MHREDDGLQSLVQGCGFVEGISRKIVVLSDGPIGYALPAALDPPAMENAQAACGDPSTASIFLEEPE